MKVKYLTCTGVNEQTDLNTLANFAKTYPLIEFAIELSSQTAVYGEEKFEWLTELCKQISKQNLNINLALCFDQALTQKLLEGQAGSEVSYLLSFSKKSSIPMFQRIWLNMENGFEKINDGHSLCKLIKSNPYHRFVLPLTEKSHVYIDNFYKSYALKNALHFDVITPDISIEDKDIVSKFKGLYPDTLLNGFGGNISIRNIDNILEELNEKYPENMECFIAFSIFEQDKTADKGLTSTRLLIETILRWLRINVCKD